jgi:hypothetical protein
MTHEGLVIEPGRQKSTEPIVGGAQIEIRTRPAIDAARVQPLRQRDAGCDHVRCVVIAAELDDGVAFLNAGRDQAARPMIFETAPDHADAIGE